MKRFRVMAAALCAAVLLCGFSVPAYAYADGGEGAADEADWNAGKIDILLAHPASCAYGLNLS